jgi:hypothetical protein
MLAARAWLVSGLPLMHPPFYIRLARVEEAAALSDLCFRSKAVYRNQGPYPGWGGPYYYYGGAGAPGGWYGPYGGGYSWGGWGNP